MPPTLNFQSSTRNFNVVRRFGLCRVRVDLIRVVIVCEGFEIQVIFSNFKVFSFQMPITVFGVITINFYFNFLVLKMNAITNFVDNHNRLQLFNWLIVLIGAITIISCVHRILFLIHAQYSGKDTHSVLFNWCNHYFSS